MSWSHARAMIMALKSSKLIFRLAQLAVIGALVGLVVTSSLAVSEGPDEVAHYFFIRYIAQNGRLPLNAAERLEAGYKADLPPLFYLLAGLPATALDLKSPPYLKSNRDEVRLNLITGIKNVTGWRMIKTEDPLRGQILLWYWARWVTLATGLAAVGLIFVLARAVAPPHPWLALAAVALLIFLPTFVYINSVTNYEPLTAALMAAFVGLLWVTVKSPRQNWRYLGLGLIIGLAAVTRQTVWPVLAAVPLLVLWLAYRRRWGWATLFWQLGLYSVGVLLTFGAWLLYLLLYFNKIAEKGWLWGLLSPILIGDGSGQTSLQIASLISNGQIGTVGPAAQSITLGQWAMAFFTGLWGHQTWLLAGAVILWAAVLAGLAKIWRQQRLWLGLLGTVVGLLLLFPLLRFLFSGKIDPAVSRHFLFPAAPILAVGLAMGASAWPRFRPYLTGLMLVLVAGYLTQNVNQVTQAVRQDWAFPVQTVPLAAEPVLAQFDTITLIQSKSRVDGQTLDLALQWRADGLTSQDYRMEITLLDAAGQPQARWLGQPVNGRYPTRAWLSSDRVRDDIKIPVAGLSAGDYQLRLRVLGDDGPVPAASGEVVELGAVSIKPVPAPVTGQLRLNSGPIEYTFWPPSPPITGLPLFTENQSIMFTVASQLAANGIELALVGPGGVAHAPADQTGRTLVFTVAPQFAAGEYKLRAGQASALAESEPLLQVKTQERQFEAGPIASPLEANFAGYVTLLGYNLPRQQAHPGEALPLTMYWQARRIIGADLMTFYHLIGPDGRQYGGADRRPRDVYSTMLWASGEIVDDPYLLTVAPNAPPGDYYLLVGLYLPVGVAPVSLPLMQDGQMSDVTHVTIGPIAVVAGGENP